MQKRGAETCIVLAKDKANLPDGVSGVVFESDIDALIQWVEDNPANFEAVFCGMPKMRVSGMQRSNGIVATWLTTNDETIFPDGPLSLATLREYWSKPMTQKLNATGQWRPRPLQKAFIEKLQTFEQWEWTLGAEPWEQKWVKAYPEGLCVEGGEVLLFAVLARLGVFRPLLVVSQAVLMPINPPASWPRVVGADGKPQKSAIQKACKRLGEVGIVLLSEGTKNHMLEDAVIFNDTLMMTKTPPFLDVFQYAVPYTVGTVIMLYAACVTLKFPEALALHLQSACQFAHHDLRKPALQWLAEKLALGTPSGGDGGGGGGNQGSASGDSVAKQEGIDELTQRLEESNEVNRLLQLQLQALRSEVDDDQGKQELMDRLIQENNKLKQDLEKALAGCEHSGGKGADAGKTQETVIKELMLENKRLVTTVQRLQQDTSADNQGDDEELLDEIRMAFSKCFDALLLTDAASLATAIEQATKDLHLVLLKVKNDNALLDYGQFVTELTRHASDSITQEKYEVCTF